MNGVLGVNGAGKSTILRIMAGVDKDFVGEAWVAEGATVGYLSQEPDLDPAKDVQGNVIEGLGPLKALMDRFHEVSARFGEALTAAELNDPLAVPGALPRKIDGPASWDIDRQVQTPID